MSGSFPLLRPLYNDHAFKLDICPSISVFGSFHPYTTHLISIMHIRPATFNDIPTIALIASNALRHSPLIKFFCLYTPSTENKHVAHFRRKTYRALLSPGHIVLVVEMDEQDEGWNGIRSIMGYAHYIRLGQSKEARRWRRDSWERRLKRVLFTFEETLVGVLGLGIVSKSRYSRVVQESRRFKQQLGDEQWDLNILAVAPVFQRRGVGTALVEWVLERAKEEGVPVSLEATVEGEGLYLRMGFVEVGKLNLNENLKPPAMVFFI